LRRWQEDRDLAGIRDAAALTKLPAEERAACTQLWADVAALVQKAQERERTLLLASAAADRDIAAGRTQEALAHLATLSAASPEDTLFFLQLAALQAWFGQDQELAATCRRGLAWAKNTTNPGMADAAARVCCLLPSTDKAQREAALALARKAVQLDKDRRYIPWSHMTLGMAEYRNGHFAEADAALIAAANRAKQHVAGPSRFSNLHVAGTSALYRAMSLFRQGKQNEARQLAIEAAAKMRPLPKDEKNPLAGNANHDELILWLAYKEAKALIQFDAAAGYRLLPLSLVKAAPDIVGVDIGGKTFRLSDYRGKVVLLDFFADGCPDCAAMYPHERWLVKKYANRPFVLLGVNLDLEEKPLKQRLADQTITWRCWWDGNNHIAQEWKVNARPRLFLIDHQGMIRQDYHGRPDDGELEAAVQALVEAAGKGP
jgi:thiol-disulfide isomerase/thioredoxin